MNRFTQLCRRWPAMLALGATLLVVGPAAVQTVGGKKVDPEAVERTRDVVKLLDNVNKAYVVNITGTYVKAQEHVPAARIVARVFKHMAEQGFMTGRLMDVSGKPANENNVAQTDFEKRAAKEIKAGKAYVDEVAEGKNGKAVLRAATVVPVVMKACLTCHPGLKEGDVMGALVYEVPIR